VDSDPGDACVASTTATPAHQQDKNHLIDHQGKGSRGELHQIRKALQLSMPFFDARALAVAVARFERVADRSRVEQHPILVMTIAVDL
jgi:DNA-binding transcriptional regulator YiaG